MEFVIGGTAAVAAGFFTNPLEVLKTRMQLQGELKAKGKHAVYYRNILHAGYVVAKNDGILALQKGLIPALWVQWILNGVRLGIFNFFDNKGYIRDHHGNMILLNSIVVSGFGGVCGQLACSPMFLVKTHLQAEAAQSIAVGHQHHHKGMVSALKNIYVEQGVKGVFRGASSSVPRILVGSVSQLTSFEYSKQFLSKYEYFNDKPLLKTFIASMIGGVAISIMMNPFDLILTRVCNQPVDETGRGKLYHNYMDCVNKVYKTEGFRGFYKGLGPNYVRLGPHTVLCLVFWDELNILYKKYQTVEQTRF